MSKYQSIRIPLPPTPALSKKRIAHGASPGRFKLEMDWQSDSAIHLDEKVNGRAKNVSDPTQREGRGRGWSLIGNSHEKTLVSIVIRLEAPL